MVTIRVGESILFSIAAVVRVHYHFDLASDRCIVTFLIIAPYKYSYLLIYLLLALFIHCC